jgi:hypothetical protein
MIGGENERWWKCGGMIGGENERWWKCSGMIGGEKWKVVKV